MFSTRSHSTVSWHLTKYVLISNLKVLKIPRECGHVTVLHSRTLFINSDFKNKDTTTSLEI